MRRGGPGISQQHHGGHASFDATPLDGASAAEADLPSDEDELQDILGYGTNVSYRVVPFKKVRKHEATLRELLGGEEGDSVLVCGCGWVMRFDKSVKLDEAESLFVGHAQPGLDWDK